jgi:hypothetical protein
MLFSTKAYYTRNSLCRMFFGFCDKTVQDKLNHVIFWELYNTVAFDVCFIMIAYLRGLSWIWKLNVSL